MIFWVVLLALDFSSVVLLILGDLVNWSVAVVLPFDIGSYDFGFILKGSFGFVASLALLRTIPFVKGVLSLLELNKDMTLKAIKARNQVEMREQDRARTNTPFRKPENFGRVVRRSDR